MELTNENGNVILVCLSASPSNERVIRAAARMCRGNEDTFLALYVGNANAGGTANARLNENISLAKNCGAHVDTMETGEIALTIAEYAKRSGVTDLFIGESARPRLFAVRSIPDQLIRYLPDTNIHIIPDAKSSSIPQDYRRGNDRLFNVRDLLMTVGIMAVATILAYLFYHSPFSNSNIITIYILAVLIASVLTSHQLYGLIAAVLYILLFNFLFIEPRFTLLVYDPNYLVTYFVTIIAALITGSLAARLKSIAWESAENAYQAKVLLDTSDQLQKASSSEEMVKITCTQLSSLLNREVRYYRIEEGGRITMESGDDAAQNGQRRETLSETEREAVLWTWENGHHAGALTNHYSDSVYRYLSIFAGDRRYGVLAIRMAGRSFTGFEKSILLSIVNEFTMALDNDAISREKQLAEINAETERFRSGLLRSVSHDLRTPLTAMYGNAVNLSKNSAVMSDEEKQKIYTDLQDDALWLSEQMENILSLTRLENNPDIVLSPVSVDEVIEEALRHMDPHSSEHEIIVADGDESIFAMMDAKLIVAVLVNLLNNAIKYTPAGSRIEIRKEQIGTLVHISVSDDGNGIPDEEKPHVFSLYYTGKHSLSDSCRSMGIGLNLCAMILHAHHQTIEVRDNIPHGAVFSFTLEAAEVNSDE